MNKILFPFPFPVIPKNGGLWFPFPNFGNGFFHSLPVPEFWEWIFFIPFPFPNFGNGIFSFPSHSRNLGLDFFIPFPFPNFGNGLFQFPSRSRTLKSHSRSPLPTSNTQQVDHLAERALRADPTARQRSMAIAEIEKDDTIMNTPWCIIYKMFFPFEVFPRVNSSPVEESAAYRALDYRPIATVCRSPGRYNNSAPFGRRKYQFRTCAYTLLFPFVFGPLGPVWNSSLGYNATHSFRVKKII